MALDNAFVYGADIGWAPQLEKLGYVFLNPCGEQKDIFEILSSFGVNAVRFRLFVNPPKSGFWDKTPTERCMMGYCDTESVICASKRAQKAGMKIMLDFHYSDYFADPHYQILPEAWKNHSISELTEDVARYTCLTMNRFKDEGIIPTWVQVGNEINPGMMLPMGDMKEHPDYLVSFLNAGYDSVKKVFPECDVITHLACGADPLGITEWFDSFFAHGGRTDIIGLSHYPYWYDMMENVSFGDLGECMCEYVKKYKKPCMVVEVGSEDDNEEKSFALIKDTINALKMIPNKQGLGVFYWEPEASREVLPDKYPLGASKLISDHEIKFTNALSAYGNYR